MEVTVGVGFSTLLPRSGPKTKPDNPRRPSDSTIKKRLLRRGVVPTPKILHALRKKELQKSLRKSSKQTLTLAPTPSGDPSSALLETVSAEYRALSDELEPRGRPWEGKRARVPMRSGFGGGKLRGEYLEELRGVLEERNGEGLEWVLDDGDLEEGGEDGLETGGGTGVRLKERLSEDEKIGFLVKRAKSGSLSPSRVRQGDSGEAGILPLGAFGYGLHIDPS